MKRDSGGAAAQVGSWPDRPKVITTSSNSKTVKLKKNSIYNLHCYGVECWFEFGDSSVAAEVDKSHHLEENGSRLHTTDDENIYVAAISESAGKFQAALIEIGAAPE